MQVYLPAHKPSTPKPVVCAALVRLEGVAEPMFLYFDAVKHHAHSSILEQLKVHWTQTLGRSEPLPKHEVLAQQEFLAGQQDIATLAQWLKTALPRARTF
jgi:hypothetical protein